MLNVQGFGWSGGSLARDILVESFDHNLMACEFGFIGDPDGVLDVVDSIWGRTSHLRPYSALKRFKVSSMYWTEVLRRHGYAVENFFSVLVAKGLIEEFPFSSRLNLSLIANPLEKNAYKLRKKVRGTPDLAYDITCSKEEFLGLFQDWFDQLLVQLGSRPLLQKAVPISLTEEVSNLMGGFTGIVVNRSNSDSFVSMSKDKGLFLNESDYSIESKVKRFSRYKNRMLDNIPWLEKKHGLVSTHGKTKILYLEFESIVHGIEETLSTMEELLNLKVSSKYPKHLLENSKKNIGIGDSLDPSILKILS